MPDRKTLIFHIGDPKTGSSSIQRTLFERNWSCPGRTLAYPERLNEIPLAKSLHAGAPAEQKELWLGKTAEWLARQQADVAVLSAEHFAFAPPQALKDAVDRHLPGYADQVRVAAYVRPHLSRLLSSYAQRVKTRGLQQDFETFCRISVRDQRFHYTPRFLAWREVFGGAFTLRPFIREQLHRQDVVADFLQQALGSDDFTLGERAQVNDSPGLDHLACLLAMQRRLQKAGIEKTVRHALGVRLAELLTQRAPSGGTRMRIPEALLPELQAAYRQDAGDLDATFFAGAPMSQALEEGARLSCGKPQSIRKKDRFTADEIRRLNRELSKLAAALAADPASWTRQFRQTKRLNITPAAATAKTRHISDILAGIAETAAEFGAQKGSDT